MIEEILPSNQRQIIARAKFAYSPLGNGFEKQAKTIEYQWEKQTEALEDLNSEKKNQKLKSIEGLFPKEMRYNEIKLNYGKKKLNEEIWNMKLIIFNNLEQ